MKKSYVLCFLLLLLLIMAGCGKEKEVNKELADINKSQDRRSDLAKEIEASDTFQCKPKTEDGYEYLEINAEVEIPENAEPGIYKEQKIQTTLEDAKKIAKTIFDGGTYMQVKPLSCYSIEELKAEMKQLKEVLKDKNRKDYSFLKGRYSDILMLFYSINIEQDPDFKPSVYVKDGFSKNVYMYDTVDAHGNKIPAQDGIYIVEGTIEGEPYRLLVRQPFKSTEGESIQLALENKKEGSCSELEQQSFQFVGMELASLAKMQEEGKEKNSNYDLVNGAVQDDYSKSEMPADFSCEYSEDEAKQMAVTYLEKLNPHCQYAVEKISYTQGAPTQTYALRDLDEDRTVKERFDVRKDGYYITCVPQIDQLPASMNFQKNTDNKAVDYYYSSDCGCVVRVDSNGVMYAYFNSGYKITDSMADTVKLLHFSELKDVVEEEIKKADEVSIKSIEENYGKKYENGKYSEQISKMQLQLGNVKYDDKWTACPIWVFYDDYGRAVLVIQAVDGTVLHNDYLYRKYR